VTFSDGTHFDSTHDAVGNMLSCTDFTDTTLSPDPDRVTYYNDNLLHTVSYSESGNTYYVHLQL
jgi:lipopolysaccharide export system protein LptC